MKTFIGRIVTVACSAAALSAGAVSAQILKVESVSVDTVWKSDSSWYDSNGIPQQRTSRDCKVSFIPKGEGMARMFIAISIDSGKTWAPSPNPLSVMNNGLADTFITGQKATITVRVLGGDRPGVAFKMTARQAAPVIEGNPKIKILGLTEALTPGANIGATLNVRLADPAGSDGFCPLARVYWDALGDGTIDDSTTGVNALTWTWQTQVPTGVIGQKRGVIVRALDKNNLWSAPETLSVQFGLLRPLGMKDIPGGTFSMGTDDSILDYGAQPVHQVSLDSFYMDSTEVTQEEYYEYMQYNPSSAVYPYYPVENVSWFDAVLFCNARSRRDQIDTVYSYSAAYFRKITTGISCSLLTNLSYDLKKKGYRLPTEAEWEYACRAGTTTECFWGTQISQDTVDRYAWFAYNSSNHPNLVAWKLPNRWGLYDMLGNVSEWCNDWYQEGYTAGPAVNPVGSLTGTERVHRGGAFNGNHMTGSLARSATRDGQSPETYAQNRGFRCVRIGK